MNKKERKYASQTIKSHRVNETAQVYAGRLGIAVSTLYAAQSEDGNVSDALLDRIAGKLGYTFEQLIGRDPIGLEEEELPIEEPVAVLEPEPFNPALPVEPNKPQRKKYTVNIVNGSMLTDEQREQAFLNWPREHRKVKTRDYVLCDEDWLAAHDFYIGTNGKMTMRKRAIPMAQVQQLRAYVEPVTEAEAQEMILDGQEHDVPEIVPVDEQPYYHPLPLSLPFSESEDEGSKSDLIEVLERLATLLELQYEASVEARKVHALGIALDAHRYRSTQLDRPMTKEAYQHILVGLGIDAVLFEMLTRETPKKKDKRNG